MTTENRNKRALNRFNALVMPEPNTGCWIWSGRLGRGGYGVMRLRTKASTRQSEFRYAHRLSYFLHKGEYDYSLFVCHRCDNTWCVNPDHLFLGTYHDNMKDMRMKGRNLINNRRGEKHHNAKLTEESVLKIRELSLAGITNADLSRTYGVRDSVICEILKNRSWKHVSKNTTL